MKIVNKGGNLPSRIVYYGLPGIGKTSWATHAPSPFFILMRGETGLRTLIDAGLVPPTDHNEDEINDLNQFQEAIEFLTDSAHPYKTVVIDALTGLESVIFDRVCAAQFKGDTNKFNAYGAGPAAAIDTVEQVFNSLDYLRSKRRVGIILLAHSKVGKFKNPEGLDYNRYAIDCEDKTWGVVNKWADMVLFGKRSLEVKKDGLKTTGKIGDMVMHTCLTAAFDAKNRLNLPEEIDLGPNSKTAWHAFSSAVKSARDLNKASSQPVPEPKPEAKPEPIADQPGEAA